MADKKKISMSQQRKSIEDAFNGVESQPDYTAESNPFAKVGQAPLKTITLTHPDYKEVAAQQDADRISKMQQENLNNPEIAAKLAATNASVQRYNEMMRQKLQGLKQPAREPAAVEAAPGEVYDAMEPEVDPALEVKKAFLRKQLGQE